MSIPIELREEWHPPEEVETLWRSDAPLEEQLRSGKGEGYLMRVTDPQLLIRRLRRISRGNYLVHEAILFALSAHEGQKRRNSKPYVVHPFRVAIRDAATPEITPIELVIDLLHDTAEECGTQRSDIVNYFTHLHGHDPDISERIWTGISALSSKTTKGELKPSKYHKQIARAHVAYPELHLIDRKTGDRGDNLMDDLLYAVEHPEDPAKDKKIHHYLPKANDAFNFGRRFEPESRNTKRMSEALELARKLSGADNG